MILNQIRNLFIFSIDISYTQQQFSSDIKVYFILFKLLEITVPLGSDQI
jgi:hypothetical protein